MSHETLIGPVARKRLWKVFWIMLVITIVEIGLALTSISKEVLRLIFIAFTIVKAYYIVFFFMHLKHEKVHLAWTILLPFILIVYFIAMVIYEGTYLHDLRPLFGN